MRKGWTETTLGEIASFYNGKTYKQEELLDSGKYRVLRVGNFFSNGNWYWSDLELEENKYCDRGDLLYAWSASFGPRIWSGEKAIYHYHIWKIVEDSSLINKQFLYYWLDEDVSRMKRDTGNGSIMMHITKGGIEARTIQLPLLDEQKRIVDVVSSVDAYIDALQQQADTARAARNAVLHELLSAGGDDWSETAISDVADVLSGFAFKSELFKENEGIPLIRIRDLQKKDSTETGYTGEYEERYVVNAGDFLIGMDGEFRCYEWLGPKALLNQRVCRIQSFDKSKIIPRFVYFLVNQYLEKIEESTSFTTVKHISVKQVKDIRFPMPPLSGQERIVEIVSSMDEVIQSTEQALIKAKTLRSGLLSDLLSGNHEIPASYDSLLGAA